MHPPFTNDLRRPPVPHSARAAARRPLVVVVLCLTGLATPAARAGAAAAPSPAVVAWADALPATLAVKSPALQKRWQAWRAAAGRPDLLGPGAGADDPEGRKAATAVVRNGLTALDADLPVADDPARPAGVAAAIARRREAELAALSSGLVPGLGQPQSPSPEERAACAASFARWTADLAALADDARLTGSAAGQIWTLDDLPDRFDRRPRWAGRLADDLDVLPEAQDAADRLDALAALLKQPRAALVAAARSGPAFDRRYAAWQALTRAATVEPRWLTQPGDLTADDAIRDELARLAAAAAKGSRGKPGAVVPPGLPAEAEVKQRWAAFAAGVGSEPLAKEAVASLLGRGGRAPAPRLLEEAAAVGPAEPRFNVLLGLARELTAARPPPAADADLAALRAALADAAAKLPADRAALAQVRRRLGEREPFAGKAAGPAFDLPLPGGGAVTLLRVQPKGTRAFYLSADEVTLGQFARAIRPAGPPGQPQAPPAAQVMSLLRGADARVTGPRVWQLAEPAGDGLGVHVAAPSGLPRWLPAGKNDYADALRDPKLDNREVLDPAAGGSPSESHPMQQVPAAAAVLAALLVDCRLPTTAEWAQATEAVLPAGEPTQVPNLRDPTWVTQWRYVLDRRRGAKPDAVFPDEGAFVPTDLRDRVGVGPAAVAAAADPAEQTALDRTLYFRPSSLWAADPPPASAPAAGRRPPAFRNLVGNVAELTFDAPEALAALPADKSRLTAAAVDALLRDYRAKLRVIGLSALSAPALKPGEPYPIDPASPYADVGFRLAFTAPFTSEADRLQWVIQNQGYLPLAAAR